MSPFGSFILPSLLAAPSVRQLSLLPDPTPLLDLLQLSPDGVPLLRAAAVPALSTRSPSRSFPALSAAHPTEHLLSPTTCSALDTPLVVATLARVTLAAPLSTPPRLSLVSFLGVTAVLSPTSLVYTLAP